MTIFGFEARDVGSLVLVILSALSATGYVDVNIEHKALQKATQDLGMRYAETFKSRQDLERKFNEGDAEVELGLDRKTGNVFVRVNGQHIHGFAGVCKPASYF